MGTFQSTYDSTRIGEVRARRNGRSNASKLRHESVDSALADEASLELGSYRWVVTRLVDGKPARHGAQVKPRPTNKNGHTSALGDRRQGVEGMSPVVDRRERFVWIDQVQSVVRHSRPVRS